MPTSLSWRRVLALPLAITLALGGALIAAGPASADPADFSLASPANGSTVDSRTVTFTGTGTPGYIAGIADATTGEPVGVAFVSGTGTWSVEATFADSDPQVQSLVAAQASTATGAPEGVTPFAITLPEGSGEPAPEPEPSAVTIETPVDIISNPQGITIPTSRTVLLTGTAPIGSFVVVSKSSAPTTPIAPPILVTTGDFELSVTYTDTDDLVQTLIVGAASTSTGPLGQATTTFLLPPVVLATPTIDTPPFGSVVEGPTVPLAGTGTAGATVALLVVPTSTLATLPDPQTAVLAAIQQIIASGEIPTIEDLAQLANVVAVASVAVDGTWSSAFTLVPENYTALAIQVQQLGQLNFGASALSAPTVFQVIAPVVVEPTPGPTPGPTPDPSPIPDPSPTPDPTPAPSATPSPSASAAASSSGSLPYTGAEAGGFLGLGALLLLAGAATLLIVRRNRVSKPTE